MAVVWMIFWWYSDGWMLQLRRVAVFLAGLYDYFSIDLIVKTLFAPFRQISAGKVQGPFPVQVRAFFDRLISRIIGSIVRTIIIIFGTLAMLFFSLLSGIWLVFWMFIPIMPIAGVIMMAIGWMPWR